MQLFFRFRASQLLLPGQILWKYRLPCLLAACATFPACDLHGGYNSMVMMFLMLQLCITLEMMQNDVETSEIEYRSMEIHLFLHLCC